MFPPVINKRICFSASLPTFGIAPFKNVIHLFLILTILLGVWWLVSCHGLNVHFLNGAWCWAPFRKPKPTSHQYIFFSISLIRYSATFLLGCCSFLLLSFKCSLYSLDRRFFWSDIDLQVFSTRSVAFHPSNSTFHRRQVFTFSSWRSLCPSLLVTPALEAHKVLLILLPDYDTGSSFPPFLTSFFAAVSFQSS